jgi:hypothetical protein
VLLQQSIQHRARREAQRRHRTHAFAEAVHCVDVPLPRQVFDGEDDCREALDRKSVV